MIVEVIITTQNNTELPPFLFELKIRTIDCCVMLHPYLFWLRDVWFWKGSCIFGIEQCLAVRTLQGLWGGAIFFCWNRNMVLAHSENLVHSMSSMKTIQALAPNLATFFVVLAVFDCTHLYLQVILACASYSN